MSTPSILFTCYFMIGLVLMVVAVATRGKERRAEFLDISQGSPVDAGMMIFIVLLWPIWLFGALAKDDDQKR